MEVFEDLRSKTSHVDSDDDEELMRSCFQHFDRDDDEKLNRNEFRVLLEALFANAKGESYHVEEEKINFMYEVFAKDRDKGIDQHDFQRMWTQWIKVLLHPVCALIIVDVQNDFISGSIAVCNCEAGQDGEAIVPVINRLLENVRFEVVAYTLDWHPENHISFIDNVKNRKLHECSKISAEEAQVLDTVVFESPQGVAIEQILWPKHTVQDTWGAQLHRNLRVVEGAVIIKKGDNPDIDSYSGFWDNKQINETELNAELRKRNVTDVFVCGIAYDICVASTAMDALDYGYRTVVVYDGCSGTSEDRIESAKKKFQGANGVIVASDAVPDMVDARDRRPELGYQMAMQLAKS